MSPAPLAAVELGAPSATVMFKSSTSNVATLRVVVSPLTIKLPVTVKLLLMVVRPVTAPMLIAVAAPNALTVVEVVFNKLNVV